MGAPQWRDLNDHLARSSFLSELCNLVNGDAPDSFYSQAIHLHSLISPHIPQWKMTLQDFSLHVFLAPRELRECGAAAVKMEAFAAFA